MRQGLLPPASSLFVGYLLVFSVAAVACFVSASRARAIDDAETRRGLVGLLLTSGVWAVAQVVFLVVPSVQLKTAAYIVGLVTGFSTVGPWLYFCSAYTGRTLHRNPTLQRLAIGIFLAVVAVKVTNPLHQFYFTAELVTTPFPHLAVQNGVLHWVVVGLAYALAAIGYFMLFELFWQVGHDARPLVVLVTLTGLPIIPDIVSIVTRFGPEFTFEPIGVAVFAVGVLYLYLEEFQALQLTGTTDDPVIVLDDDDRVREYNTAATELFPELTAGVRIDAVVPESEDDVIEIDRVGGLQYYHLSTTAFGTDASRLGEVLTLTDITERERYRADLERQNERLEQFANTVSHDLRNPLDVAQGHINAAREARSTEDEHLETAAGALSRMGDLIQDVLALARNGQPIDETQPMALGTVATDAWSVIDAPGAELVVGDVATVVGDSARVRQLLENLFRNAIEHGGDDVVVRVGPLEDGDGFYVADDGPGIPAESRDQVFDSGHTTADTGTGFGLAIVAEIADAHGWGTRLVESAEGGARFEFAGVAVEPADGGGTSDNLTDPL